MGYYRTLAEKLGQVGSQLKVAIGPRITSLPCFLVLFTVVTSVHRMWASGHSKAEVANLGKKCDNIGRPPKVMKKAVRSPHTCALQ